MRILTFALLLSCYTSYAQVNGITISQITSTIFRYTTWRTFDDMSVPANGLYAVTDSGVVLFDTPFDTTQFIPLLKYIGTRHQKNVVFCLATHSHDDRTPGLEFYAGLGISTWTSVTTDSLCLVKGEKRAANHFVNDTAFSIGNFSFQVYYPGKGHTPDNVVVYFPEEKVLYGGCFVKSVESGDLGNLADADVGEWEVSMKNLMAKFPDAKYVIPGHFEGMEPKALKHTLKLIQKHLRRR